MKFRGWAFLLLLSVLTSGCVALKDPQITKRGEINQYSFVVLPNAASLSSSSGSVYGDQNGVYGSSSSKEINPSNIIEGILLKKGLFSTSTVTPENKDKTLIVKYLACL